VLSITQLGIAAKLGLLVCAVPLAVAIAFALRPNERWLALMRPLTLAAIFTAIANTCLGFANTFRTLERLAPTPPVGQYYAMLSEVTVVPFLSFVFLSLAWLCIALGMRRQA
jgi:hypothetical protein